jgi:hypothetical protein
MQRLASALPQRLGQAIVLFILLIVVSQGSLGMDVGAEEIRDADDDGDGLSNADERDIFQSDPNRWSVYEGDPFILLSGTAPREPTSDIANIRIWVQIITAHLPQKGTDHELTVTLSFKTLTKGIEDKQMTLKIPKSISRDDIQTSYRKEPIDEIWGFGYTEDPVTIAYRLNYTVGIGQFSTGEEISYYVTATPAVGNVSRHPWKDEFEPDTFEMFKVQPAIEIVDEVTQETAYALIFAMFFGSIASWRMKQRLSKMSYTDIQWWDAVNKKAFVKVIRIFSDVKEVKQVLKRISGRSIRFLYFTGITGLLMLAFELLYDKDQISQLSLFIIGFFLIFTCVSPVLYVYFSRWKHKNPTIGKIRLLFFFLFPLLIIASFANGENIQGYVFFFMFFYSIPMLLYGNLMGTNWNFLIFNSYKEFRSGFDHLNNARSAIPKRIFAFFFFWAIFSMPLLSINSIVAVHDGTYEEGGVLGVAADQMIEQMGYDYYAQMFSNFIAIFIILNVILLGVAMVFRVVQLQFYASQKFSGKMAFGLKLHFKVRDNIEDQRSLIAFAFFVFFGYSVLLLLLAVYSQTSQYLPVVPGLSADILQDFLYYQSICANIIFTFFWFVSLPKLPKIFKLKRHEGGFIIPK